jgi:hypothetical protein
MTRARVLRVGLLALPLLLLVGLVMAGMAWAGSSAHYAVDWQVLSSGGAPAESSSGLVALNGSLGQTAIGPSAAAHGSLGGGYWYGAGARRYEIYLPMVIRN